MLALTGAMADGDLQRARKAQFAMRELNSVLFVEANPIPVKAACAALGWIGSELRLPLLPLAGESLQSLRQAMANFEFEGQRLELAES